LGQGYILEGELSFFKTYGMKIVLKGLILVFILDACNHAQVKNSQKDFSPKVSNSTGYTVPKDSMAKPKVIPVDESKLKKNQIRNPEVIPTNINTHLAGKPNVILAGSPRICIPGQGTFSLPKNVPATGISVSAGIPEVVLAKDAYVKDNNRFNFSSFNKQQGLKHNSIRCMLQDQLGNLWFGTDGGGVTRFDGKSFTHFTEKEGLSDNRVWSIYQDHMGDLWFGTYGGGVTRYDGKSFTHFTDKGGLQGNTVISIFQDKSGNIWFGTIGKGISKFNGESFTIYGREEGFTNNGVMSILQDHFGNLWFGTDSGGLFKYDGKSFANYTKNEGLSGNSVYSILQDNEGNLWFGTYGGGVSKYDGKSFTNFTEKEGLSGNYIYSILQDHVGNLWFCTYGKGITKYDGISFTQFTEKEGLSSNFIFSVLQDRRNTLWFGTYGGGVTRYDGKSFTQFTEKEGLSSKIVVSILQDKNGNLWFGTYGGGVSKYDGKSFTNFMVKEGLSNDIVMSVAQDKNGDLWFGTYGGGVTKFDGKYFTYFTEKEGLSYNFISSILCDQTGNLWFGTPGNGVSKYDGKSFTNFTVKEGLSSDDVVSIFQDRTGIIWFGTNGGGVSNYDGKSFTHFSEKEGLSNNKVRTIIQDQNGNIWFGTLGGGISKYDGESFTSFTEKEGLSNNFVLSLFQDKAGNLWIGTRFGLQKLSKNKMERLTGNSAQNEIMLETGGLVYFKLYGYEDGFLGSGINGGNTFCEVENGTIWIASNDRLVAYHPEGDEPDTIPPNIQLTGIELFNENIAWAGLLEKRQSAIKDTSILLGNGVKVSRFKYRSVSKWYGLPENLSLAYNNNYLTFNFIGITLLQSKKVRYQYKLDGIDENWSAITDRTAAPYGNLPHGRYTFRVKAMNSEGYWSNAFNYVFTIRPPWWKTWLFRSFLVLTGILTILSYIKWRERNLRREKLILEQKVREQTHELLEKNDELNQQNEEITSQRDEIKAQRDIVTKQKEHIEVIHKELTESINYASRIQRTFMATIGIMNKKLNENFILFRPKEVVSGDFYWVSDTSERTILAAADCTGHGVPGALMSMLGKSFLDEIVNKELMTNPGTILNWLRKEIIASLKQKGEFKDQKDGMDIALCTIDWGKSKLQFAGAINPLYLIRNSDREDGEQRLHELTGNDKLIEFKGDSMPVGIGDDMDDFTVQEIDIHIGDEYFLFTDGYPDQFGGPSHKKFSYKSFKEQLFNNRKESMSNQKHMLEEKLNEWMGDNEQTDDILVIGFRIS
jgi:ligand-binding sensor domain-containing protein/serine phosphatase RsbU (regulator of sigma subunit)